MSDFVPSARTVPNARLPYALLVIATALLGLSTRVHSQRWPVVIAQYGGDTLWAAMIVWIILLFRPLMRTTLLALLAFAICAAVESSQLYHAAWIDAIRATRAGALALGHGFLWSDLVCYSVGVLAAITIRHALIHNAARRSR